MNYINQISGYYEGDKVNQDDLPVPQRPSFNYDWSGNNWVINTTKKQLSDRLDIDNIETLDIKNDSAILALLDQSKLQWAAWAGANFPSLTAPEKNKLGLNFWVLAMCARRLLR